ncbi:MAG: hypothetical protein ACYTGX_13140 [Planctomycetota bacterium]
MRLGTAAVALIPILAVALTAGAVDYVASSDSGSIRTTQLLRRAEGAFARESFDAEVVYGRKWSNGHMQVTLGVQMTPTGAAQVQFLGMESKQGITRFRKKPSGRGGMAVGVTGLQERLRLVLDHDLAARNYGLEDLGDVTLAGRKARRYRLVPKLEGLGALQLTVDAATGLPLERIELTPEGKERDAWRVDSIRFGAPQARPTLLVVDTPKLGLQARPSLRELRALDGPVYLPSRLPRGFQLRQVSARPREDGHFVKLLYTDGVAHFVVLQWRGERTPWSHHGRHGKAGARGGKEGDRTRRRGWGRGGWGRGGFGRSGRHHGYGAKVEIGGSHIRVMGPLSKEMLRDIAERLVELSAR